MEGGFVVDDAVSEFEQHEDDFEDDGEGETPRSIEEAAEGAVAEDSCDSEREENRGEGDKEFREEEDDERRQDGPGERVEWHGGRKRAGGVESESSSSQLDPSPSASSDTCPWLVTPTSSSSSSNSIASSSPPSLVRIFRFFSLSREISSLPVCAVELSRRAFSSASSLMVSSPSPLSLSSHSALRAAASAGSSQPLTASLFLFSSDPRVALFTLQLLPEFPSHPTD